MTRQKPKPKQRGVVIQLAEGGSVTVLRPHEMVSDEEVARYHEGLRAIESAEKARLRADGRARRFFRSVREQLRERMAAADPRDLDGCEDLRDVGHVIDAPDSQKLPPFYHPAPIGLSRRRP